MAGAARRAPRPRRPDVQDLAGEDRQDRDRAAEQHREQVQRDRAHEDRAREEEGEALAHAGDQRRLRARRGRARRDADARHHHQRRRHQRRRDRVRPRRADPGIEDAAQRRPGDGGDLPDAGPPGDRARVQRARDQLGAQRVARRQEEAARRAADHDDRVDDALDQRARAAAARGEEQRARDGQPDGAEKQQHQRRERDAPPVAHVGHVPGVEREPDERGGLGEAHQAQRQRIARHVVHLPGDHEPLDLGAHRHRQDADDEPPEIRNTERCVRVVGAVRRGGGRRKRHRPLD